MINPFGHDYPAGAKNDPRAPYNEVEQEYVDCNVNATFHISKSNIPVSVNDYEADDDEIDTSECDFVAAFYEEHQTPADLIRFLAQYVRQDIRDIEQRMDCETDLDRFGKMKRELKSLHALLDDCEGWEVDNCQIEKS